MQKVVGSSPIIRFSESPAQAGFFCALYVTFWALWNETVRVVGAEEPTTVESIVEDLQTQIRYYDEHGIGALRGGIAPIVAGQIGAGRRQARRRPPGHLAAAEHEIADRDRGNDGRDQT
jgi:hypothetical protein